VSVGLDSLSLPPSPPPQEAQYAKAGAEEREGGNACYQFNPVLGLQAVVTAAA